MKVVEQTVRLRSEAFGNRPTAGVSGEVLRRLQPAVKDSVLMTLRGQSAGPGRPPTWLSSASDIRFIGVSRDQDAVFHFEVSTLGESAAILYDQNEIWPNRPDPGLTSLDLLAGVIREVRSGNEESDGFDSHLLQRVSAFKRTLSEGVDEIIVEDREGRSLPEAIVSKATVETAETLRFEIPPPRQVRVAGMLDMIRVSTQTLALRLDDGNEVKGVFLSDDVQPLAGFLNRRVVVLGKAIYRPSGRVLRIDVDSFELGEGVQSFWSRVPRALDQRELPKELRQQAYSKCGVAAFFGTWPGDETDEELLAALHNMS